MSDHKERRPALRWAAFLCVIGVLIFGGFLALNHPKTPVPTAWNPFKPLHVQDPVTPLTAWKLRRALSDPTACRSALAGVTQSAFLDPLEVENPNCGIENRVRLETIGQADIQTIETSCAVALRMALWEQHGLQPSADEILGTSVRQIRQIGSYNCRRIRSPSGGSDRWSTHATGEAIDITGFRFADGTALSLVDDWDAEGERAEFLRAARDSACDWFPTTLGPDFNTLHADHFHLQSRGWGTCR